MNQKGFAPLILLIGLIIIIGIVGGTYYLETIKNHSSTQNLQPTLIPQASTLSSSVPTSTAPQTDAIPQENTIYLGKVNGIDAVFFTNKKNQQYFEPGAIPKTSPNVGALEKVDGTGNQPFEYNKLQNPRKILTVSSNIQQVNNLKFDNNRTFLYLSLMLETNTTNQYPNNLTNHIYKINLDTLASEDLWSHDMWVNKYKGADGAAYMKEITPDNSYLVLSIDNCFACSGVEAGLLILNNQTKNEKYFKSIGNIQFNLNDGTFTYQKLFPVKEPCSEPGPECDSDNTRTVYKPSGQVYTEKLP